MGRKKMKSTSWIASCLALAGLANPLFTQQTSKDVMAILRASIAAQSGKVSVQEVNLTGSAEYIAGSDDETAQFSFKGTDAGSTRFDLLLSSGTLSEIRANGSSSAGSGGWFRGNGARTSFAGHNMLTDSAWCFPLFVVQRFASNGRENVSFVGTENGLAHFQAYQQAPPGTQSEAAPLVQHLSQMDLFLDPMTFLPAKLSFDVHPDNNALIDIPVVVQFSDYKLLGGVSVPLHIQKYINGTLAIDINVRDGNINSGTQQSDFSW
jgi:hypothetical protein